MPAGRSALSVTTLDSRDNSLSSALLDLAWRGFHIFSRLVPDQGGPEAAWHRPPDPMCPAIGSSPTVTCPWAEERARGAGGARSSLVAVSLDVANLRQLRSAPAGKQRFQPPDAPLGRR